MSVRDRILEANRAIREGRTSIQQPTKLEDGFVSFRIPTKDYKVLARIYPDLDSKDHAVRLKAWHDLRRSPVGEKYLVTRTPRQVKQADKRIIIK